MEWISDIFTGQTFTQAILILCIICAAGLALAKIRFWGISLGVTFVFFTGILAGHLGITINQDMLLFAQNFGLVIYIYSLGVQVGPGFFTSFKQGGVKLNLLATSVLIIGSAMAVALVPVTGISLPDMMGLLCGAVTNTPMLGAGQQTLLQIEPGNIDGSNDMALACAVGYPFGVIGVILAVIVLKALFRKKYGSPAQKDESLENTFVAEYHVSNPAIFGRMIDKLMIKPEDLRNIAYDIIVCHTDTPKDFTAINFYRATVGIDINASYEINIKRLLDYCILDNEEDLRTYFKSKGFELEDVVSKEIQTLTTIGDVITKHIIDYWMEHLNKMAQELTEILPHADEAVPLCFVESSVNVFPGNALLEHAIDKARVEIVARPNGAHGFCLGCGIFFAEAVLRSYHDRVDSPGADEFLAIEG